MTVADATASFTIFQNCKFDLYKLLLGVFVFFNENKVINDNITWITKKEMLLFLNEQEYRFNHRNIGKTVMDKVKKYKQRLFPISHRQIGYIMIISATHFS